MTNRFLRAIKKPRIIPISILHRTCKWYSDEFYLKILFRLEMGYPLNLKNPQTFNEKLNWMKLYYRNPVLVRMADKYLAKSYVASIIGDEYVVQNYGVWDTVDKIDFDNLPKQFVLKSTGDSSGIVICKDKSLLDIIKAKEKLSKSQNTNYYYFLREWVYKDIQPKIIADKFLDDKTGNELRDYKFLCFNGVPKVMYCTNKGSEIFENYYDMDFNVLDINHGFNRRVPELCKPEAFDKMKILAAELSKGLPFVRVDFFYVNGSIYFGEYTFYDWGGMRPFVNKDWDIKLGSWITLPENHEI